MKYRLKKLYQTLTTSISAGAVKTLQEWNNCIPMTAGLKCDLHVCFPEWFEKVSTLVLATRGYNKDEHVSASTADAFRYDGKRLTELQINANASSYEDIKELIDFLTVVKCCFQHTTYNELPKQYPLTPSDCYSDKILDHYGRWCSLTETVFYFDHNTVGYIAEIKAGEAKRRGLRFFKFKHLAKQFYEI